MNLKQIASYFIYLTPLSDYELTFWTNDGPTVSKNFRYKLRLIINGTDGITGSHRCSTRYNYPYRDLHCAFSDSTEIGDVTCLTFVFIEKYISVDLLKVSWGIDRLVLKY